MSCLATNSFQNRPSTSAGLQFPVEDMSSFATNSFQDRPSTSSGLQFSVEDMSIATTSFQDRPSTSTGLQFSLGEMTDLAAAEAVALSMSLDDRASFHSPEMRFFVNGPLSVNTEDHFQCGICDEPVPAFSICINCNVLLCDMCVYAHHRARLTREHQVSLISTLIDSNTSPNSESTESSSQNDENPPDPMQCDEHLKPKKLYCHSCKFPTCDSCYLSYHDVHNVSHFDEAVIEARHANIKLLIDIRTAINGITEIIDVIQGRSESTEQKFSQTAADVRNAIQRYKSALDERETEMLKSIDSMRQMKGQQFMGHVENLKIALSKLLHTSDLLHHCLKSRNSLEILDTNEQAVQTLKLIQAMRPELLPSEDEALMFLPPDNGVLRAISSLSVGNNPPAAIALDSLPPSPPSQPPSPTSPSVSNCEEELANLLGNRPIYNVKKSIVARSYRLSPSLLFGTEGNDDGQLCRPWGVCCDRMGNIIVADRSNNRIQIFDCRGKFLHKFGSHGTAPGQFDRPAGVTINPTGQIVVADKDNHRIQIFKMDGTFIRAFGEKGTRFGQFNYPWDVACNSVGHIIVSDTRNHRIQLFTSEGMYLNKYGFEGSNNMWKHFDSPRGVCFTPSGGIVVTDFNNHRVVVVDPYFAHAQYLGHEGSGAKQFLRPQGVVCDDDGNIIIADSRNNRIQVYHNNGSFLWSLGRYGQGSGQMDRPSGICLNPDGRIVVVDFGNNRVQIF